MNAYQGAVLAVKNSNVLMGDSHATSSVLYKDAVNTFQCSHGCTSVCQGTAAQEHMPTALHHHQQRKMLWKDSIHL